MGEESISVLINQISGSNIVIHIKLRHTLIKRQSSDYFFSQMQNRLNNYYKFEEDEVSITCFGLITRKLIFVKTNRHCLRMFQVQN